VLGGGAVATSGYFLMFPFYATDIAGMQLAQIVHGCVAVLFVAAMLAHIYIGTIAWKAPSRRWPKARSTRIGRNSITGLWLDEEKNKAPAGATPRATPAE